MGNAEVRVDNGDLEAKLELRRYFLSKYHTGAEKPRVLDCCQGSGVIWGRLRKEFELASYWGLDVKPKAGRLKIDSARVLAQPGWKENVIDVDTYGSPWKHWVGMQPNVERPLSVFLTIGQWQMGTDSKILEALGLGRVRIPPGIAVKLHELAVRYLLTTGCTRYISIIEAKEVVSLGNARYLGIRIEPKKNARQSVGADGRAEPAL